MNKKGFTLVELIGVVTLLALIALIVYPSINTVIKNSREKAYKDQIEQIVKAAKQWGVDNAEELPDAGQSKVISTSLLLQEGYITNDDIVDPRNTSNTLTGNVIVMFEFEQYVYEYIEKTFKSPIVDWLKSNTEIAGNQDIYSGSNPDNYIRFNSELWRIVKINSDSTVKIIRNEVLSETRAWDIDGGGYWNDSSLNRYLNTNYYSTIMTSNLITPGIWCTGNLGSNICETSVSSNVGLINGNEILEASASGNCDPNQPNFTSCGVSNYLKLEGIEYYTITGDDNSENHVYKVANGILTNSYEEDEDKFTKNKLAIRPAVNLKPTVKIVGGTGTSSDPFIISG